MDAEGTASIAESLLSQLGVPHDVRVYPGAGHSYMSRHEGLFATLAERMGQKRAEGSVFVALPLSRQDIADLVGTTIETAIRVMSRWQKEGVVETDKKGFLIRDPRARASIAPEE